MITPSTFVDGATPWVHPYTAEEKVVASGFWFSFGLTSTMVHLFALVVALGVLPFTLSVCSWLSTVHVVEKPPEQRVEVAMVKLPPPPPPEPPAPPPPPVVEEGKAGKPKKARLRPREAELVADMSVLAILGSVEGGSVDSVFSANDDAIGGALSGLIGGEVGGVEGGAGLGGLGVRGSGGGGGAGDIGGLGTSGRGSFVAITVDDAELKRTLSRAKSALSHCVHDEALELSVVVSDGKISEVSDACARRSLLHRPTAAAAGSHSVKLAR